MEKHKAEKQRTANSTYKKLAVQWLNEALCRPRRIKWWQTVFVSEIANFL
jgi:hypothetical protein